LEDIVYNFDNTEILDIIGKKNHESNVIDINEFRYCFEYIEKDKYNKLIDKYRTINKDAIHFFSEERFKTNSILYNKKLFKNTLVPIISYWIIHETEKYGLWEKCLYPNYETYININKIPSVYNFMLFVSNYYLSTIESVYGLKGATLNITEMFISKYSINLLCWKYCR
jgi:hypothetical protein